PLDDLEVLDPLVLPALAKPESDNGGDRAGDDDDEDDPEVLHEGRYYRLVPFCVQHEVELRVAAGGDLDLLLDGRVSFVPDRHEEPPRRQVDDAVAARLARDREVGMVQNADPRRH